MLLSPFLPQIYHKFNLLKIMVLKCILKLTIVLLFSTKALNTRLIDNVLI